MKAIITVVGKDRTGIVAGVSSKIAELGLNIDEIFHDDGCCFK